MVLSVCLSVFHKSAICQNNRMVCGIGSALGLSYIMMEENSSITENNGTSLSNFVPAYKFSRFFHIFPTACRLSQYCQLGSLNDHWQFVILSVHHCLQHYGHDELHHSSSSASAETCFIGWMPCTLSSQQ